MKLTRSRPGRDQRNIHVAEERLPKTVSDRHPAGDVVTKEALTVRPEATRIVRRPFRGDNQARRTVDNRREEIVGMVQVSYGTPVAPEQRRPNRRRFRPVDVERPMGCPKPMCLADEHVGGSATEQVVACWIETPAGGLLK